jgi:hypothetical protein
MIGPEDLLADLQRSPCIRLTEHVPTAGVLEASEVVIERRADY